MNIPVAMIMFTVDKIILFSTRTLTMQQTGRKGVPIGLHHNYVIEGNVT